MFSSKKKGLGILGGSFDPPHKGHLKISLISLKKLDLKIIYWIITKKNPFKKNHFFLLKKEFINLKKLLVEIKKLKFCI